MAQSINFAFLGIEIQQTNTQTNKQTCNHTFRHTKPIQWQTTTNGHITTLQHQFGSSYSYKLQTHHGQLISINSRTNKKW